METKRGDYAGRRFLLRVEHSKKCEKPNHVMCEQSVTYAVPRRYGAGEKNLLAQIAPVSARFASGLARAKSVTKPLFCKSRLLVSFTQLSSHNL